MVRRELVDLFDVVESQREDLEKLRAREGLDDLEASIQEVRDEMDQYETYEDVPESLVDVHDELVAEHADRVKEYNERKSLLNAAEERLEEYVEMEVLEDPGTDEESGWASTEFRLKELSMGDIGRIRDKTGVEIQDAKDAYEAGEGAAMIESARLTTERTPQGAPDDPANLPLPIGQLVLLKSHELAGMDPSEGELGKSSARQYMTSTK